MIGQPHPSDGAEAARVEALRRLDARAPEGVTAFDDLVELLVVLADAQVASLVLVEHERAWCLASTLPVAHGAEVPRAQALADMVVREDHGSVVRVTTSSEGWAEHPSLAGLPRPATVAAQAVCAPGGEVVGALEVAWEGTVAVDGDRQEALARSAELAAELLALRADSIEYGRFIELNPDPIAILDLDGAIERANAAFATMLGVPSVSELIGRGFLELVARPHRARATAELARVLFMQRRTGHVQLSLVGIDGRVIPCSVSAGHLRGVRRHLQLIVHDLSEQIRVEEEHSRLSEQLARAQRLDVVGQIAGGLAHDLNNLLAVMVANLGLAEESLELARGSDAADELEAVADDLAELQLAIDRASGLTTQLLQFARHEEGARGRADVTEVIDGVGALVLRSLGPAIALHIDRPDGLPPVDVDPVQLERVVINLVINAREAIEGRGTIGITVSRHAGGAVPAPDGPLATGRETIRIEVTDDGCGMDDATRARAFEPLFTSRSAAGGSGLGLATVLAVIDQADGHVTLESEVGVGTTVTLWLPAGDSAVAGPPVGVDVPVMGARIVLVDPGERTRRVIAAMLTGAGYRITEVASGEDALHVLARDGADLLVTDLALPGIPGPRLLDAVSERFPTVSCIALASVDQPRTLEAVPVVVKPFSHTRLLRTVDRVVEAR